MSAPENSWWGITTPSSRSPRAVTATASPGAAPAASRSRFTAGGYSMAAGPPGRDMAFPVAGRQTSKPLQSVF